MFSQLVKRIAERDGIMEGRIDMNSIIEGFKMYLVQEEKSENTIEKYVRDAEKFLTYLEGRELTKQEIIDYKNGLLENHEATSVNSYLAAVNKLLKYIGRDDLKVKSIRIQQSPYSDEKRTLTIDDYHKLCEAAGESRNHLMITTICSTGIRVSELRYFTVEAVSEGAIEVRCKGKIRRIIIPGKLQKHLLYYVSKQQIESGPIFCTRNGRPMDRGYIWKMLKKVAEKAGIDKKRVFPHNLRKLFARKFYEIKKDIVKLADVLGHSSINTTRIYLKTAGIEHRKMIEVLKLIC